MRSERSCSSPRPQSQLPSGTASRSVGPSNTIAFTTSADAAREAGFVDGGAWIALHSQAREQWELLREQARNFTVPFLWSSRHSHFSIVTPIGMPADMEGSHLRAQHGRDSSMRVARSGAALGLFSTRGSARAVRRRRHQLCDHEARANSARICVRSSLCRRRVQVGGIAAASTATRQTANSPAVNSLTFCTGTASLS